MATLAEIAATVADMLARADLDTQIKGEISRAIRRLRTETTHLNEVRGLEFITVAGAPWYSTLTTGNSTSEATLGATVDVSEVLNIQYMRETPGSSQLNEGMLPISYLEFERLFEGSSSSGDPEYYTLHAGQIGLWPTPSAAQTIYLTATVRPLVPVMDGDMSVYFEEAGELVEMMTAERVARKFIRDYEQAAGYERAVTPLLMALKAEASMKRASGRIMPSM